MGERMEPMQPVRPSANDYKMPQPRMQRIEQACDAVEIIHGQTFL
jgi:hypothetical protein